MKVFKLVFPGIIAVKVAEDLDAIIDDVYTIMGKASAAVRTRVTEEEFKTRSSDFEVYEVTDEGDVLQATFYLEGGEVKVVRAHTVH